MRMAEIACGSSASDFRRLKISRQEIPASTRIRVVALATTAQFPRLPLASMVTVTLIPSNPRNHPRCDSPLGPHPLPCSQHTRPPCGCGSNSLVNQYLRNGFRLPVLAHTVEPPCQQVEGEVSNLAENLCQSAQVTGSNPRRRAIVSSGPAVRSDMPSCGMNSEASRAFIF